MSPGDLEELVEKFKFGDKVMFRHEFEKWKVINNISNSQNSCENASTSSQSTPLPSSQQSDSDVEMPKLLKILKNHKSGRQVLQYYTNQKKFNESHRNIIIRMIVEYFDSRDIPLTLQTSHRLENEILELFPTEKIDFYRTERRGKIYMKYHNKRKLFIRFETDKSEDGAPTLKTRFGKNAFETKSVTNVF